MSFGRFDKVIKEVTFETINVPVKKKILLLHISIVNNGKNNAIHPAIKVLVAPRSKNASPDERIPSYHLTKRVILYDSIIEPRMSSAPDDHALAISFLRNGLENIDELEGEGVGTKFVFGFIIEDSKEFVLATEKAASLRTVPMNNELRFRAGVKADNTKLTALFMGNVILKVGFAWDQVNIEQVAF